MLPKYLTLGINLLGESCLIVGGGKIAWRKAKTLDDAGANVIIVAPALSVDFRRAVDEGRFEWIRSQYAEHHLQGCFLVIAATSDPIVNRQVGEDARRWGMLCCVTSSASESQLLFPANWTDEQIVVSVHSHGRICRRSVQVRDRVAAFLEGSQAGKALKDGGVASHHEHVAGMASDEEQTR